MALDKLHKVSLRVLQIIGTDRKSIGSSQSVAICIAGLWPETGLIFGHEEKYVFLLIKLDTNTNQTLPALNGNTNLFTGFLQVVLFFFFQINFFLF